MDHICGIVAHTAGGYSDGPYFSDLCGPILAAGMSITANIDYYTMRPARRIMLLGKNITHSFHSSCAPNFLCTPNTADPRAAARLRYL